MAKAIYEKRTFTNRSTGEIIPYDWYGIVGIVNGERMELPLKELNAAEKISFKIVASGVDPDPIEELDVSVRKADTNEEEAFKSGIEKKSGSKTILDDDDDEGSMFD